MITEILDIHPSSWNIMREVNGQIDQIESDLFNEPIKLIQYTNIWTDPV